MALCSLIEVYQSFISVYCLHLQEHHCPLMMRAVRTSETSVYFYETTQCHILESCHFIACDFSLNIAIRDTLDIIIKTLVEMCNPAYVYWV
jgi:hypothetical protein